VHPDAPGVESKDTSGTVIHLTGPVEQLLSAAKEIAATRNHPMVGTEHVLLAMIRQSDDSFARRLLDEVGATEELRRRIEEVIGPG
jgi:ATP-dependent Clp protease ATP-binding subunit ClpC